MFGSSINGVIEVGRSNGATYEFQKSKMVPDGHFGCTKMVITSQSVCGLTWYLVLLEFVARACIRACTAVARLPLRLLGFLVTGNATWPYDFYNRYNLQQITSRLVDLSMDNKLEVRVPPFSSVRPMLNFAPVPLTLTELCCAVSIYFISGIFAL